MLRGSIYLPTDFVKVNSTEHQRGAIGHELSQHRRELQEQERRIEREIKGLRDNPDVDARELHAELRQIH